MKYRRSIIRTALFCTAALSLILAGTGEAKAGTWEKLPGQSTVERGNGASSTGSIRVYPEDSAGSASSIKVYPEDSVGSASGTRVYPLTSEGSVSDTWVYLEDGARLTGWHWIDGNGDGTAECYYMDADGTLRTDTTIDGWAVNADGAWTVNGVVQTLAVNPGSHFEAGSSEAAAANTANTAATAQTSSTASPAVDASSASANASAAGPGLNNSTAASQNTGTTAATQVSSNSAPQARTETWHRKTPEELQAAMAAVPAGPAKAEWGTFFLGNNLPPRNDEDEGYLRQFHAYGLDPTEEKVAYLTFDEGYENGYTPVILDILAKHRVKAAFFCTGSFVRESPELVKRFHDEGHIIGNHTLSHPSMMKVSSWEEFSRQLFTVEDMVKAVTGADMPRYYRPPAGAYSEAQLRMADALGFRTVFWSVAYKDWDTSAQPTHERAMNYLTTRIHPGAIILLHAVSKTNAEILDELLTTWEEMGYTFRTLDDLTAN